MPKIDKRLEKYFWDGLDEISDSFFVKRMLEYASFPDLLKIPIDVFIKEIKSIDIQKLRTSDKRKRFLELLLPYIDQSNSWNELIYKMAKIN